jgi:hypothetical protein
LVKHATFNFTGWGESRRGGEGEGERESGGEGEWGKGRAVSFSNFSTAQILNEKIHILIGNSKFNYQ